MTKEIGDSTLVDTWAATGTITEPDISKKNQGWTLGERPPFEFMNWLQNTFGKKINHMLSRGVADWDTGTSYAIGATVNHTGSLWVALVANDASEPTGANTNWSEVLTASVGKYESAEITIPSGGSTITTLSHGLGAVPFFVTVELVCKVADLGYAVGDRALPQFTQNDAATATYGVGVRYNSTSIDAVVSTGGIVLPNFASGGNDPITPTSWRLVFKAELR